MEGMYRLFSRVGILDTLMAWATMASVMILLMPADWIAESGMPAIQPLSSLLLIVGLAYFFSRALLAVIGGLKQRHSDYQAKTKLEAMVSCLDHTERAVLREFVINRKTVLTLPVTEPAVKNLLDNGVLEASEPRHVLEGRSRVELKIALAARPLLSYKVLGLPVGRMSEEQLESLKAKRPRFLRPEYQANRTHNGKLFRIRAEFPSGEHAA